MKKLLHGERAPWALPAVMMVISMVMVSISGYWYTGESLQRLEQQIHEEQRVRDAQIDASERARDAQWCSTLELLLQNDPRKGPTPATAAGKERVQLQIKIYLALRERATRAGCKVPPA